MQDALESRNGCTVQKEMKWKLIAYYRRIELEEVNFNKSILITLENSYQHMLIRR